MTPNATAQIDSITPYLQTIRRLIEAHLAYPDEARRWGIQGTIHLQFSIDPQGHVVEDSIRFPQDPDSGDTITAILQRGARQTLDRIDIFPSPPQGQIAVEIPLTFKRGR